MIKCSTKSPALYQLSQNKIKKDIKNKAKLRHKKERVKQKIKEKKCRIKIQTAIYFLLP